MATKAELEQEVKILRKFVESVTYHRDGELYNSFIEETPLLEFSGFTKNYEKETVLRCVVPLD